MSESLYLVDRVVCYPDSNSHKVSDPFFKYHVSDQGSTGEILRNLV